MKLYSHPGSCSSAAYISLLETGLDFELVTVNLRGERELPDGRTLIDVNPKGYVPVLELDDGTVITELVAMLPYIADLNPSSKLAPPAGTMDRIRMVEWLAFISSELHKTCSAISRYNLSEESARIVKDRLAARFTYVDTTLIDREYLVGDSFSVADAYMITVLGWESLFNFDLSPYGNITRYMELLGKRESVRKARQIAVEFSR